MAWKDNKKAAAYNREYRKKRKDKISAYNKAYRARNVESSRAAVSKWGKQNKKRVRDKQLQRIYGITLETYNTLLKAQKGCCAICGNKETVKSKGGKTTKSLAVDHCHKTGSVRGLLCYRCNTAIGYLSDSPLNAKRAFEYLTKHSKG